MPLNNDEQNLRFGELQTKFLGSAKIHLRHLLFEHDKTFLDPKNIKRLTQIFELEGCHRLEVEHRVPAIIDDSVLRNCLVHSHITNVDVLKIPIPPTLELPAGVQLTCLHGKHRIAAAKAFLLPGDNWWTVDLYSGSLNETLRQDLKEEYANSRNFCDGDIFRQLRWCQQNGDSAGEGRWFARLSECKRTDIKHLQRREELQPVASALDELIPYPGIWPVLQIGTLHRVLNMKCPEELKHYLHHVRDCWKGIIDNDDELKQLIDFQTVQKLQLRNPWASERDRETINDLMRDNTLFPLIPEPLRRHRILKNILAIDYIIPSLYTFFEDTKWLEPCAKILRKIIPTNSKTSIRRSMFRSFCGVTQSDRSISIQLKSLKFCHWPGSELQAVECGYRQLWLFAWRHFPELSSTQPRKDVGKLRPQAKTQNDYCWTSFACLARSLGFESENITGLLKQDSDSQMAFEFLRQARPKEFWQVPDEERISTVNEIVRVLRAMPAERGSDSGAAPERQYPAIQHRCGRPYEQSYRDSKSDFFFQEVYATKPQTLTHFAVNRDIFHAFFGSEPPSKSAIEVPTAMDIEAQTAGEDSNSMDIVADPPQADTTPSSPSINQMTAHLPADGSGDQRHPMPVVLPSSAVTNSAAGPHVEGIGSKEMVVYGSTSMEVPPASLVQQSNPHIEDSERALITKEPMFQEFDLQKSNLFEAWEKDCKDGDIFAVCVSVGSYHHFTKSASGSDRNGRFLPQFFKEHADEYFYAAYSPTKMALSCLVVDQLWRYVKDQRHDGVIYALKRPSVKSGLDQNGGKLIALSTLQSITGETTQSRLHALEDRLSKKRGQAKSKPGSKEAALVHSTLSARRNRSRSRSPDDSRGDGQAEGRSRRRP